MPKFIRIIILFAFLLSACQPKKESNMNTTAENPVRESGQPNHLIDEKSPYLLQHAYNPVDWYPWGEEAFEKARRENKLIFLSIGYSTCHWCHVMEAESFEDEEVAQLLNETFVSIKVDREERPDIDAIYMDVAMALNGSGGWPLNIIMTAEQEPFFAGTYIPKDNRFGRDGLMQLLPQVRNTWINEPKNILNYAEHLSEELASREASSSSAILNEGTLDTAYQQLSSRFDAVNGGFGQAPKFPAPHNLLFLMRYYERNGDGQALTMVTDTLLAMRQGGIYDHVGFGFHRYATDAEWLTPHFEKMLYDQAMLAMAYTEAYQITKDPAFEQTAREIFTYVLRDMTDSQGAFYTAEDADSEGAEGKFYLWTEFEIREILPAEQAELVLANFNITQEGNFTDEASGIQSGTNIPHITQPLRDFAPKREKARQTLFDVREERVHPYKDDKILTDWNGLMIAALSKASQAFDEPLYATAAVKATDFIFNTMLDKNGRLNHRYREGEAGIQGSIDDYAFLVWGLLELYETTFDIRYLEEAIRLQEQLDTHFADEAGGYYMTPDDGEKLLLRPKKIYDGAYPSGNSVAMLNLLRLGRITANAKYEARADALGKAFSAQISQAPVGYSQLLNALDFGIGPSYEIVIVGEPNSADTQAMLTAFRQEYIPNKVVLLRPPNNAPITQIAEFTKSQYSIDEKATAYVCLNYHCQLPTTDVARMLNLLDEVR